MPIYEEKLISPLAVRFTQDHIRKIFRDGTEVQRTIEQMTLKEGSGDYDFIISAPFPNIEIIRWYQEDSDGLERDADHWFTLDNRRLYCLQRVAASVWPKRVAATVDLLYSVPHSVRRKDSSATAGRTVAIGHNNKLIEGKWDWKDTVGSVRCRKGHELLQDPDRSPWGCDACGRVMPTQQRFRCLTCNFDLCEDCHSECPKEPAFRADSDPAELAAMSRISRDDKKTLFQELVDAPAAPSLLEAFAEAHLSEEWRSNTSGSEKSFPLLRINEEEEEEVDSLHSPGRASVGSGSTEASISGAASAAVGSSKNSGQASWVEPVWPDLSGTWRGSRKETYEISFTSETLGSCVRTDADGQTRNFTLKYDCETHTLWWGSRWAYFVDLGSLAAQPTSMPWYYGNDMAMEKPAFYWNKKDENVQGHNAASVKKGSAKHDQVRAPKAKKAAKALKVGGA
jgi:hypothetical protein